MIPKIAHRIWFDQDIAECPFNRFWDRFAELHPDWELRTWNDSAEVRAMIPQGPYAQIWDAFIATDPYGRIPDLARYVILEAHGGFYIDTDVEPLRPFDDLLGDLPVAGWEDDKSFSTAVLGAPPHHDAVRRLIEVLPAWQARHYKFPRSRNPVFETGPSFATAHWRFRDDVRRYPPVYFFPVHWKQMPELHPPYPQRSYCVHHWASGWKSAKEKEHVQQTSLVGEFDEERRAYLTCYMPEAELVSSVEQAEGEYVAELHDPLTPVERIRAATRAIKESRLPIRFDGPQAKVYRRDRPQAAVRAL